MIPGSYSFFSPDQCPQSTSTSYTDFISQAAVVRKQLIGLHHLEQKLLGRNLPGRKKHGELLRGFLLRVAWLRDGAATARVNVCERGEFCSEVWDSWRFWFVATVAVGSKSVFCITS